MMNAPNAPQQPGKELPEAKVTKDWKTYLFWLVPLAAAALAAWFIYSDINRGPKLHIYFSDATRLEPGKSPVMYRGAIIGQVEKVELTPDTKQADVTISLTRSARGLARENSRFWIVKAHVGAAEIQGLGTLVSGDFITVEPGDGKPETKFQGLDDAPIVMPHVLTIVLLSERQGSLQPQTPVYYRGVQVGEVARCDLDSKSQTVRTTVDIRDRFAPLVRMNSVFWNAGGINFTFNLSGANLNAQSAKELLSGGIDFATPDTSQKQAPPGTSFRLYDKPQDAWLAWSPEIDLQSGAPATRQAAAPPPTAGGAP